MLQIENITGPGKTMIIKRRSFLKAASCLPLSLEYTQPSSLRN